jgi:hypothetical protein
MTKTQYLQEAFRRVNAWAMSKCPQVSRLSLHVRCHSIKRRLHSGDPRALFHVGHKAGKVCTIDERVAVLPVTYLVGLFLHEMGHPLALKLYKKSEQWHADRSIKRCLGVQIRYRGPLLLEWVPSSTARMILRFNPKRRP